MAKSRTKQVAVPTPTAVLYAVRRRTVAYDAYEPSETGKVARVFATKKAAEACRAELETVARAEHAAAPLPRWPDMPPELGKYTALPGPVLRDWIEDAGLTPPARLKSIEDLLAWWDGLFAGRKKADRPTRDQQARLWEALNKFRFYEVVKVGWVR